jgi:hypothetical protein
MRNQSSEENGIQSLKNSFRSTRLDPDPTFHLNLDPGSGLNSDPDPSKKGTLKPICKIRNDKSEFVGKMFLVQYGYLRKVVFSLSCRYRYRYLLVLIIKKIIKILFRFLLIFSFP